MKIIYDESEHGDYLDIKQVLYAKGYIGMSGGNLDEIHHVEFKKLYEKKDTKGLTKGE